MSREKRQGMLALFLVVASFIVCFALWSSIAPLAPFFKKLYNLSVLQVSVLVALPVLLGSLARIPIGILSDRFGGRRIFLWVMILSLLPIGGVMFINSYGGLLIFAFFVGLIGSTFAAGVPFASKWFSQGNQGLALGVLGFGNIGNALSSFVLPHFITGHSWQYTYAAIFAVAFLVMIVSFFIMGKEAPDKSVQAVKIPVWESIKVFMRNPLAWLLACFYALTFGGFVAMSVYLPSFLVGTYGLQPADAALRCGGFILVATLLRPIGGLLSDKIGGSRILTMCFVIIGITASVLLLKVNLIFVTGAFLLMACAFGAGGGAVFKLVPKIFPNEVGIITGLVGAAGGLGGFFPPILMGFVKSLWGSYAIGFVALALMVIIFMLINLRVFTPHGNRTVVGKLAVVQQQ